MKLSVIIPVFNVRKYLEECLDSLLCQTFKNFEIILVDDGSWDGSEKICDEYASSDERVKVFHKNNKGPSSARNYGIDNAVGEYIMFVDSDDYIGDCRFFERIVELMLCSNFDVLVYGCTRINDVTKLVVEKSLEKLDKINSISEESRIEWLVKNNKFAASAWLHVLKREYLIENSLKFNEEYPTGEDLEWIFRVMLTDPVIMGIDCTDYVYRIRENSLCTREKESKFWQYRYKVIVEGMESIKNSNSKNKVAFLGYMSYLYYILLGEIVDEPIESVKRDIFEEVDKIRWISKYSYSKRARICKLLLTFFGVRRAAKILNKRVKERKKY